MNAWIRLIAGCSGEILSGVIATYDRRKELNNRLAYRITMYKLTSMFAFGKLLSLFQKDKSYATPENYIKLYPHRKNCILAPWMWFQILNILFRS